MKSPFFMLKPAFCRIKLMFVKIECREPAQINYLLIIGKIISVKNSSGLLRRLNDS